MNNTSTITNSGTLNGVNVDMLGAPSTITNNSGATINMSGTVSIQGTSKYNEKGTSNIATLDIQAASNPITLFQSAQLLITNISQVGGANDPITFSGSGCGYVSVSGTISSFNNRLANPTQGKIQYCGPASSTTPTDGGTFAISSITNATPDVVTTGVHGFVSNQKIFISGTGNGTYDAAGNNPWTITVISATQFSLNGTINKGAVGALGTAQSTRLGKLDFIGLSGCTPQSPCTTPLPIELLSFNADAKKDFIDINWTSGAEINNDFYTVERSSDGINFEFVETIKGAGNSINPIFYSTKDLHPLPGTSYYRLKQTDYDGKYENFKPTAVNFFSQEENWEIFPNPNDGNLFYIKFLNKILNEHINITVSDLMGNVLFEKSISSTIEKPLSIVELNPGLSKGIYFVRIFNVGDTKCKKLLVK
jgi:hypothetical protein